MAPRGTITLTALLLCFILGILCPAPAECARTSCCTSYSKTPVSFNRIKGYREQRNWENCRIEAIIFYTVANRQMCANPKAEWVKKLLEQLSAKLKNMSKGGSVKKTGNASGRDGSGSDLTATEAFTAY
ncbi:C-C motif chemokine 20-like [Pundamilia nyererei]|uniref:C-C motif chemokine 20-like n=1 Tax=Pundamilia nyererei TaxID=303518 RepID=A0A3B4F7Y4_9CICH|nr:PREDICTED: C-C motif chemokine 20-like [Pundamilia nyererei]XP_039877940.1 C-C motif chemokine 20-like [Simochromis diagramma]